MAKEYIVEQIATPKVVALTCDVCKTTIRNDGEVWDYRFQEFHSYTWRGGYGSKFGDLTTWNLDICDECFHKMFKDVAKQVGEYNLAGGDYRWDLPNEQKS